ncbi:septum formation inhibitor Maf [Thalassotalea sp. M1531]|uniref:7-methyl-GTP pyrophosphatase n=1 Tax=Thalassotalea algicola TaxID=2716224 RepID=A0A7Y0LBZ3_9GAMM|nr:Maf family protein [Thalassotalea algicola]NMP31409.1 septum formation inhibitor Maf [Thalassotalea algicola]
MKNIILASTSPFRRQLLEKLNLPFDASSPDIDESPLDNETPSQLVARLALAKASKVAQHSHAALIIGSDQVAVFNSEILGKPHNEENAFKQLKAFSGNRVTFLTGLAVIDSYDNKEKIIVEPFHVHFKVLSDSDIRHYIKAEKPFNCAGSFKSEGLGICLFEKLEGADPNTLIGLPLIRLTEIFKEFGLNVLDYQ